MCLSNHGTNILHCFTSKANENLKNVPFLSLLNPFSVLMILYVYTEYIYDDGGFGIFLLHSNTTQCTKLQHEKHRKILLFILLRTHTIFRRFSLFK